MSQVIWNAEREPSMLIGSEPSTICDFNCTVVGRAIFLFGLPRRHCNDGSCRTNSSCSSPGPSNSRRWLDWWLLPPVPTNVGFSCGACRSNGDCSCFCPWNKCHTPFGISNSVPEISTLTELATGLATATPTATTGLFEHLTSDDIFYRPIRQVEGALSCARFQQLSSTRFAYDTSIIRRRLCPPSSNHFQYWSDESCNVQSCLYDRVPYSFRQDKAAHLVYGHCRAQSDWTTSPSTCLTTLNLSDFRHLIRLKYLTCNGSPSVYATSIAFFDCRM